mmetsp:Transcript_33552/g.68594  ORF Transcript_33552/g.68594 Transcript_33552/m.68594 type:complete len:176 (+) Transcript_33552:274-801(+)
MSLWDSAIATRPSAPPTSRPRTHDKQNRENTYSALHNDGAVDLLGAEQELVSSPADTALLQKISNVRLVTEEDLVAEEARERAAAMTRINTDVHKIHEVFSDIAELVGQQAEGVTSIENDIEAAHGRTESGIEHLDKAAKHQKKAFTCVIIALAATAGLLALAAVAAVLYTKVAL